MVRRMAAGVRCVLGCAIGGFLTVLPAAEPETRPQAEPETRPQAEPAPSSAARPQAEPARPAQADSDPQADTLQRVKEAAARRRAAEAEREGAEREGAADAVEELARKIAPSIVVVTYLGRDGKTEGLGTGFVVAADGLIATNRHVIGEARPIRVEFPDGTRHEVVAVEAEDRRLDLAVLRIDAKNLPALPLGKGAETKPGRPVAAFGNPRGLRHSVTAGVVSALREMDGRPMLQLAMPIEQGNSGGPLVNLAGEVVGIVNMKSLVTPNLGFAIQVEALLPLLEKPNPISMERWLTIGALDPQEWKPLFGARWSQRAGRIRAGEWGQGFGGRSLCLRQGEPPQVPYEAAVSLRLDDEAGAAGLVFHVDKQARHYGFYPSNGGLRLSRFDGPDVTSWQVLEEVRTPHYRPGAWNRLRIRVEANRLRCWVNERLAIDSTDGVYSSGRVGLGKFRGTEAEFRGFAVGADLTPPKPDAKSQEKILAWTDDPARDAAADADLIGKLLPFEQAAVDGLRDRARQLEEQAERLRDLAGAVRREKVLRELAETMALPEERIDLVKAALLISSLDNEELDTAAYERQLDRMTADLKRSLPAAPKTADPPTPAQQAERLAAVRARLDAYLFKEQGFHGSRGDYQNRANSYLNEVIDDREGLPITLSVLYLELGRRLGLPLAGVGLPGHFVVRIDLPGKPLQLIDVFDGGQDLSREAAAILVRENAGAAFVDEMLEPASKREIVVRMLQNLLNARQREQNAPAMLPYLDAILMLTPDDAPRRWVRALIHYQAGRGKAALRDLDRLGDDLPPGLDPDDASRLRRLIERTLADKE